MLPRCEPIEEWLAQTRADRIERGARADIAKLVGIGSKVEQLGSKSFRRARRVLGRGVRELT